jgi:hypothetical protein
MMDDDVMLLHQRGVASHHIYPKTVPFRVKLDRSDST